MRHLLMGFFVLLTSLPAWADLNDDQLEREAQAVLSQELSPVAAAPAANHESVGVTDAAIAAAAETKAVTAKTKESEIPVFTKEKVVAAKADSPFGRIIVSLVILAIAGVGLMVAAKKYGWKKNQIAAKTQIKVLTQHHLGPKKSLAIIRVAGESILIGVTDHNISLIKSLALLDEEIAEMNGVQNFESNMEEYAEPEDEFAFGGVQDRVSLRMKELRKM